MAGLLSYASGFDRKLFPRMTARDFHFGPAVADISPILSKTNCLLLRCSSEPPIKHFGEPNVS
jgi:hypothetical protein